MDSTGGLAVGPRSQTDAKKQQQWDNRMIGDNSLKQDIFHDVFQVNPDPCATLKVARPCFCLSSGKGSAAGSSLGKLKERRYASTRIDRGRHRSYRWNLGRCFDRAWTQLDPRFNTQSHSTLGILVFCDLILCCAGYEIEL